MEQRELYGSSQEGIQLTGCAGFSYLGFEEVQPKTGSCEHLKLLHIESRPSSIKGQHCLLSPAIAFQGNKRCWALNLGPSAYQDDVVPMNHSPYSRLPLNPPGSQSKT